MLLAESLITITPTTKEGIKSLLVMLCILNFLCKDKTIHNSMTSGSVGVTTMIC